MNRILDDHEEELLCVDNYEVAEMLTYLKEELIKNHSFGDDYAND